MMDLIEATNVSRPADCSFMSGLVRAAGCGDTKDFERLLSITIRDESDAVFALQRFMQHPESLQMLLNHHSYTPTQLEGATGDLASCCYPAFLWYLLHICANGRDVDPSRSLRGSLSIGSLHGLPKPTFLPLFQALHPTTSRAQASYSLQCFERVIEICRDNSAEFLDLQAKELLAQNLSLVCLCCDLEITLSR